ncbi:hypothetical protein HHK36_014468 [Tetracentron sinense]|uniref:Uncharacterized protein n=1 Tax=Tetracentron sinense TaxID=13715 RepID=A0A835DIC5_TETSI|nr:hypothetical protein HHK36_014468 [Tetracentron sinense]
MAKIHPQALLSSAFSSSSTCYMTSGKEVFTIWMKSLVMNGNGCTVFDSNGQIVYRIDNYNCKRSNEVYLMDLRGKVLITILRKKFRLFGRWEGYISTGSKLDKGKQWFQVRKPFRILKRDSPCEVTVGLDKDQPNDYRIEKSASKSTCKIVDKSGGLVAEVSRIWIRNFAAGTVQGEAAGEKKEREWESFETEKATFLIPERTPAPNFGDNRHKNPYRRREMPPCPLLISTLPGAQKEIGIVLGIEGNEVTKKANWLCPTASCSIEPDEEEALSRKARLALTTLRGRDIKQQWSTWNWRN